MAAVGSQTEEREGVEMMQIDNFSLKDIHISDDFAGRTPADRKLDKVRRYYAEHGEFPACIVLNDENTLIDGYCTYLIAKELGITHAPIKRGYIELVEAQHYIGQQSYVWRVPAHLIGQITVGQKCLVRTSRGVQRVKVVNILRQQYPTQNPRLRNVIRVL